MNFTQRNKFQAAALLAGLSIALLAGCNQSEQTVDATETRPSASTNTSASTGADEYGQRADSTATQASTYAEQSQTEDRPMEHVEEFDGYTMRANISPTERLPAEMAEKYGIDVDPDLLLLNIVIMEQQSDGPGAPVAAEVTARYESLVGDESEVEMRAAEANGVVSYIGTLDASGQLVFRFFIEAQPEGADEPLQANFEVQLPTRDVN